MTAHDVGLRERPLLLRNRAWALLSAAYGVSSIGDWLYNLALVTVLVRDGGSLEWVALATAVRLAARVAVAPMAGVLIDRWDRRRAMLVLDALRAVVLIVLAVVVLRRWGAVALIALSAVVSALSVPYQQATVAVTPSIVDERDLAAANAVTAGVSAAVMFIGPAVAGLLLTITSPAQLMVIDAATFVAAAGAVWAVPGRHWGRPDPVDRGDSEVDRSIRSIGSIARSPGLRTLLAMFGAVMLSYGAEQVLHPAVALKRLAWGPPGIAAMAAVMGVGAAAASPWAGRIVRMAGPRLASRRALVAMAVSFAVVGASRHRWASIGALAVEGAATTVFEVGFFTELEQRCEQSELGRAMAIQELTADVGMVAGLGVGAASVRWGGIVTGLVAVALVLLGTVVLSGSEG